MRKAAIVFDWYIIGDDEKKEFRKLFNRFDVSPDDIDYVALVPLENKEKYETLFEEGTPFAICYVEKFGPIEYNGAKYMVFVGYHS